MSDRDAEVSKVVRAWLDVADKDVTSEKYLPSTRPTKSRASTGSSKKAAPPSGEVPRYEANRGPGSTAEVEFWTSRDVRDVLRSHVNYVVADTKSGNNPPPISSTRTRAFTRSRRTPAWDWRSRTSTTERRTTTCLTSWCGSRAKAADNVILETKGYDPLAEIKAQAAQR